MMDQLVQAFPEQLREAIAIGEAVQLKRPTTPIRQIYIAGMGGSGIGANIVAELIRAECKLPIIVGKSYQIPAFVGPETLAIASSYSGNTEETLQAMSTMLDAGAKIVVIASGGQLMAKTQELGLDYVQIPAGSPSPRACLGYSLVLQIYVLHHFGVISEAVSGQLVAAAEMLVREQVEIKFRAERIAQMLEGKIPVIYTTDRMESVALRLRQQINENAKCLCWHQVIPEMNHNELVGWRDRHQKLAVLFLSNRDEWARNQVRVGISKEIIANYVDTVIEIYSKGQNLCERMLYFIHLGDWISVYLANLRGVDPMEIRVIDFLKNELTKYNT